MKKRKTIQLISLLLFPVTLYFFSPAIIIFGVMEGIVTGSFILFALLLFTAIFIGRIFCSTLCPAGAVQDIMIDINNKHIRNFRITYIKWVIFTIWIGIILFLLYRSGGLSSVEPLYQTKYGISIYEPAGYIAYYIVLGIFMLLAAILGNRGGCHTICWMSPFMIIGNKVGRFLHLPSYRLSHEKNKCISCGKCSKICPMGLPVQEMVLKENTFHLECISCSRCVYHCPKKVLDIRWKAEL